MFNFSANHLLLLSRTEYPSCVVFLLRDLDTQRVYRLHDFSKALLIRPDVACCFSGRMDQPTIDVTGTLATIAINCENRLVEMNVAVDRRYTDEDQQMDYPGDLGFQFVNGIQEAQIYWGRSPSSQNNL